MFDQSLVALGTLALSTTLIAQTTTVTPLGFGFETTSARGALNSFGMYPNARLQWAEGELGTGALALKSFGMRVAYHAWPSRARSYANVTVRLSETDHKNLSPIFARNALSSPATIYNRQMDLPEIPLNRVNPMPWNPRLKIPFNQIYVHSGKRDLLIDLTLTGGSVAAFYTLDTPLQYDGKAGVFKVHGATGCGRTSLSASSFGPTFSFPAMRNTFEFYYASSHVAPRVPVVHVTAITGVLIGRRKSGV